MGIDYDALADKLRSHAMSLGHFDAVSGHEPKSVPGTGLTAALWVQRIRPGVTSGLSNTSALVVFTLRGYAPMVQEPQDEIDPRLVTAIDALITAYSGDLTLDGEVMAVDLMGWSGTPLEAQAGYVTIGTTMFRVLDLTIPLLIDSVWTQST